MGLTPIHASKQKIEEIQPLLLEIIKRKSGELSMGSIQKEPEVSVLIGFDKYTPFDIRYACVNLWDKNLIRMTHDWKMIAT